MGSSESSPSPESDNPLIDLSMPSGTQVPASQPENVDGTKKDYLEELDDLFGTDERDQSSANVLSEVDRLLQDLDFGGNASGGVNTGNDKSSGGGSIKGVDSGLDEADTEFSASKPGDNIVLIDDMDKFLKELEAK
jgi:hypothetical protein